MTLAHLVRRSGLATMLGGVLWIAFAIRLASLPDGEGGAECDLPPYGARQRI